MIERRNIGFIKGYNVRAVYQDHNGILYIELGKRESIEVLRITDAHLFDRYGNWFDVEGLPGVGVDLRAKWENDT